MTVAGLDIPAILGFETGELTQETDRSPT